MKHSYSRPFIVLPVSKEEREFAELIRAHRDAQYPNLFMARQTDQRWVGEVGEHLAHRWLLTQGVAAEWVTSKAAGQPDLLLQGFRIGVKTVKRKGPPRPQYTAQISARHCEEPVDFFLFASYDITKDMIYFLGAISKPLFLDQATYFGPGDQVHPNYVIREGHAIYNIEISKLTSLERWLQEEKIVKAKEMAC